MFEKYIHIIKMQHPPSKVISGGIVYDVKYVHICLSDRDPRKYPDDILGFQSGIRQWLYIPPRFWEKARKRFWSSSPVNKPWWDTHTKSSYYSFQQMSNHIRREMNDSEKEMWLTIRVEVDWANHGLDADKSRLRNDTIRFDTKNTLKFNWDKSFDDSAMYVKRLTAGKKKPTKGRTTNVIRSPVRAIQRRKKSKVKKERFGTARCFSTPISFTTLSAIDKKGEKDMIHLIPYGPGKMDRSLCILRSELLLISNNSKLFLSGTDEPVFNYPTTGLTVLSSSVSNVNAKSGRFYILALARKNKRIHGGEPVDILFIYPLPKKFAAKFKSGKLIKDDVNHSYEKWAEKYEDDPEYDSDSSSDSSIDMDQAGNSGFHF